MPRRGENRSRYSPPRSGYEKFPKIEEIKKTFSYKAFVFKKGKHFKYSNFAYALLGQVIKAASGMPYEVYVKKEIIQKLKLKNTFTDLENSAESGIAKGYVYDLLTGKRSLVKKYKINAYIPAAGLISNTFDLNRFIFALSDGGGNILLTRHSKRLMRRFSQKTAFNDELYGLGIHENKFSGRKVVGHAGGTMGYVSDLGIDLKNDISVVFLANQSQSFYFLDAIFEMIFHFLDKAAFYSGQQKIKSLSRYEGTYGSKWERIIIVGTEGLLFNFSADAFYPLKFETVLLPTKSKNEFKISTKFNYGSVGERARFIFKKGSKKATTLIWGAGVMKRVKFVA